MPPLATMEIGSAMFIALCLSESRDTNLPAQTSQGLRVGVRVCVRVRKESLLTSGLGT